MFCKVIKRLKLSRKRKLGIGSISLLILYETVMVASFTLASIGVNTQADQI